MKRRASKGPRPPAVEQDLAAPRCAECGRYHHMLAALVWGIHHGETRDAMWSRLRRARLLVEAMLHVEGCEGADPACSCRCVRRELLDVLTPPAEPPGPPPGPPDLTEREKVFFDEVWGRLQAQSAIFAELEARMEAEAAALLGPTTRERDEARARAWAMELARDRALRDVERLTGMLGAYQSKGALSLVAFGLLRAARGCCLCPELATCTLVLRSRIARGRPAERRRPRRPRAVSFYCDAHGRPRGATPLSFAAAVRMLPYMAARSATIPDDGDMPPASLQMLLAPLLRRRVTREGHTR